MIFLRIILLVLLIFALWNPSLRIGKGPVDVFIVIDDSVSMENKINSDIWSDIGRSLSDLPIDSRVAIIRFGKHPVLELALTNIDSDTVEEIINATLPPHNKLLDKSASNLEKALDFTARLVKPGHSTALLLIHDRQQTVGNAKKSLEDLKKQGQHIFQLDLSSLQQPDVWIEKLDLPLFADQNQLIPVSVVLGSNQNTTGLTSVLVNDKLVMQQQTQFNRGQLITKQFNILACITDEICNIKVSLEMDNDSIPQNNIRQVVVTINTLKPVLYIYNMHQQPVLFDSLLLTGYKVEGVSAELCIPSSTQLSHYQSIIVDDIAINNMSTLCWEAIDKVVRKQGTGLIVLGGVNSFAAGSYRHSLLESLLPVTAEAAQQEKAGTLVFLVDKSGSMDNDRSGNNRITLARQAIIDTLQAQSSKDNIGLISFDTEPHLLVPIQHYSNPAKVVQQQFNPKPSGGTRLKPALDFAISELEKINTDQRILVLVTDGYLDQLDLQKVTQTISDNEITLIAMVIGENVKTNSLKDLADKNNGSFLQVNKIAELPLLMRKELDQRRTPIELGEIAVKQIKDLPFLKMQAVWPDLSAYQVTKEKNEAFIFLRSDKGDPLWAMNYVGTGKVIAVPGGLGAWANSWKNWESWDVLLKGLINMSSSSYHHPFIDITLKQQKGMENRLQIDAVTSTQNWLNDSSAQITIVDPQQQLQQYSLPLVAAGNYVKLLPMSTKGTYKIAVKIGEYSTFFHFFNNATEEYTPSILKNNTSAIFKEAYPVKVDAIYPALKQINTQSFISVRNIILIIILILYVLLMLLERYPVYSLLFNSKDNNPLHY